jgi:hypothetical protein
VKNFTSQSEVNEIKRDKNTYTSGEQERAIN